MKRLFMALALLAALVCLRPSEIYALSCAEIPGVEAAYQKYDGVVTARVDEVKRSGGSYNRLELTVLESYKGVTDKKLTITEDMTWGALDGPSERGKEYLFFLKNNDGGWKNPLCSPSVPKEHAADMLAYLQGKELPLGEQGPEDGTTTGSASDWIAAAGVGVTLVLIVVYRYKLRNTYKE